MKPLIFLAFATACSGKDGASASDKDDGIVLDGEAYTLVLEPVMPPGQEDLFHEVSVLEIQVTQADGTTTTHALSDGDEGSSASSLPKLDGATLRLTGRNGKQVIISGQTPPIDLTEGDVTQPISLAQVDTLASLPVLPTGLGFAAVAAGADGRFYLFGGADEGFIDQEAATTIFALDIGVPTDGLAPVTLDVSLPRVSDTYAGRVGHTATSLTADTSVQGQILISGGTPTYVPLIEGDYFWAGEGAISSDQALLFDPVRETITEVGGFSYARSGHTATENHLGEIVAIGGFNDQASAFTQAYAEVFDPGNQSFHQISGLLTTGTAHHAAARLGEQGVMSCGGVNYYMDAATECAIISTDREISTLSFPGTPSLGSAMVTLPDDRILFTGGLDMTGQTFERNFSNEMDASSQAWIFESGAWRAAGTMTHPRAWHSALALPDGRVLISGGVTRIANVGPGLGGIYWGTAYHAYNAVACVEIYDPDTDTFSELAPCLEGDVSATLPERMLLPTGAVDPVHGAVIMGGVGQTGSGADTVMLYRPTPD